MSSARDLHRHSNEAIEVIAAMRKKTDEYCEETNPNFSLLASSAEGVSGYFPMHDKNCYANARCICEKGYYTNSFHLPVDMKADCFEKIEIEAPFHKLCNGGGITYVELSELPFGNKDAISDLVDFACNNDIGYFGINFPLDVCRACGKKGTFGTSCHYCGSTNIYRLRRVSGYLSDVDSFTPPKRNELTSRVAHTGKIAPLL